MIQKRKFGNTGLIFPELGLGTWALGGNSYGPVSESDAREVMRRALENGMTFWDSADIYGFGESENRIGAFLKETNQRENIFIATKGGFNFEAGPVRKDFSKQHLLHALDQSLKRLGITSIDLYQLHLPNRNHLQEGECLAFLKQAKASGKIRFGGVSLYDPQDIEAWISKPEIDAIQFPYNLIERGLESKLEQFERYGKALIVREIFGCGFLSGRHLPETVFSKDDHRRSYSVKDKRDIFDRMNRLKEEKGWDEDELFRNALPFSLRPPQVSISLIGIRNAAQLEEHLRNYDTSSNKR